MVGQARMDPTPVQLSLLMEMLRRPLTALPIQLPRLFLALAALLLRRLTAVLPHRSALSRQPRPAPPERLLGAVKKMTL